MSVIDKRPPGERFEEWYEDVRHGLVADRIGGDIVIEARRKLDSMKAEYARVEQVLARQRIKLNRLRHNVRALNKTVRFQNLLIQTQQTELNGYRKAAADRLQEQKAKVPIPA